MAVPIGFERIGAYPSPTGEDALAAAQQRIQKLESDLESQRRMTEVLERTVEGLRQQLQRLDATVASSTVTTELKGEVGELAAKVERITREGYILDKIVWQVAYHGSRPPHPSTITFNLDTYQVPAEARQVLLELTTHYYHSVPSFAQSTVSCEGFSQTFPLTFPTAQIWIPVSPSRAFAMTFPPSGPWSVIMMVKIMRYR